MGGCKEGLEQLGAGWHSPHRAIGAGAHWGQVLVALGHLPDGLVELLPVEGGPLLGHLPCSQGVRRRWPCKGPPSLHPHTLSSVTRRSWGDHADCGVQGRRQRPPQIPLSKPWGKCRNTIGSSRLRRRRSLCTPLLACFLHPNSQAGSSGFGAPVAAAPQLQSLQRSPGAWKGPGASRRLLARTRTSFQYSGRDFTQYGTWPPLGREGAREESAREERSLARLGRQPKLEAPPTGTFFFFLKGAKEI